MFEQNSLFRKFLRSVALVLSIIFTFTSVVQADTAASLTQKTAAPIVSLPTMSRLDSLSDFPAEFGTLKSKFQGTSDQYIIHIQDAHVNEDAQKNIAKLLKYFEDKHTLDLISVEGAWGEINTRQFQFVQNKSVRTAVADFFLKQGRLSGAEYAVISDHLKSVLFGVEDEALYLQNRQAYLDALKFKANGEETLVQLHKILNDISRFIFSSEIRELNAKRLVFQQSGHDLVAYVRALQAMAAKNEINLAEYSGMQSLLELTELETKINFEKAEKETDDLIRSIKKSLPSEMLSEFLTKTVHFRMKKMRRGQFYGYLLGLGRSMLPKEKQVEAQNTLSYLRYIQVYENIDAKLFDEIGALDQAVRAKELKTDDQKGLDHMWRLYDVISKLYDFTLTKDDAQFYFSNHADFSGKTFAAFLEPKLAQYHFSYGVPNLNSLDQDLPRLEKFYEYAIKRDSVLIENAIQKADEGHAVSAIVTGGFHTPGIERSLQERGISYLVVTPKITQAIDQAKDAKLYEDAIKGVPLKIEKQMDQAMAAHKKAALNDPRFQLQFLLMLKNKPEVALQFLAAAATADAAVVGRNVFVENIVQIDAPAGWKFEVAADIDGKGAQQVRVTTREGQATVFAITPKTRNRDGMKVSSASAELSFSVEGVPINLVHMPNASAKVVKWHTISTVAPSASQKPPVRTQPTAGQQALRLRSETRITDEEINKKILEIIASRSTEIVESEKLTAFIHSVKNDVVRWVISESQSRDELKPKTELTSTTVLRIFNENYKVVDGKITNLETSIIKLPAEVPATVRVRLPKGSEGPATTPEPPTVAPKQIQPPATPTAVAGSPRRINLNVNLDVFAQQIGSVEVQPQTGKKIKLVLRGSGREALIQAILKNHFQDSAQKANSYLSRMYAGKSVSIDDFLTEDLRKIHSRLDETIKLEATGFLAKVGKFMHEHKFLALGLKLTALALLFVLLKPLALVGIAAYVTSVFWVFFPKYFAEQWRKFFLIRSAWDWVAVNVFGYRYSLPSTVSAAKTMRDTLHLIETNDGIIENFEHMNKFSMSSVLSKPVYHLFFRWKPVQKLIHWEQYSDSLSAEVFSYTIGFLFRALAVPFFNFFDRRLVLGVISFFTGGIVEWLAPDSLISEGTTEFLKKTAASEDTPYLKTFLNVLADGLRWGAVGQAFATNTVLTVTRFWGGVKANEKSKTILSRSDLSDLNQAVTQKRQVYESKMGAKKVAMMNFLSADFLKDILDQQLAVLSNPQSGGEQQETAQKLLIHMARAMDGKLIEFKNLRERKAFESALQPFAAEAAALGKIVLTAQEESAIRKATARRMASGEILIAIISGTIAMTLVNPELAAGVGVDPDGDHVYEGGMIQHYNLPGWMQDFAIFVETKAIGWGSQTVEATVGGIADLAGWAGVHSAREGLTAREWNLYKQADRSLKADKIQPEQRQHLAGVVSRIKSGHQEPESRAAAIRELSGATHPTYQTFLQHPEFSALDQAIRSHSTPALITEWNAWSQSLSNSLEHAQDPTFVTKVDYFRDRIKQENAEALKKEKERQEALILAQRALIENKAAEAVKLAAQQAAEALRIVAEQKKSEAQKLEAEKKAEAERLAKKVSTTPVSSLPTQRMIEQQKAFEEQMAKLEELKKRVAANAEKQAVLDREIIELNISAIQGDLDAIKMAQAVLQEVIGLSTRLKQHEPKKIAPGPKQGKLVMRDTIKDELEAKLRIANRNLAFLPDATKIRIGLNQKISSEGGQPYLDAVDLALDNVENILTERGSEMAARVKALAQIPLPVSLPAESDLVNPALGNQANTDPFPSLEQIRKLKDWDKTLARAQLLNSSDEVKKLLRKQGIKNENLSVALDALNDGSFEFTVPVNRVRESKGSTAAPTARQLVKIKFTPELAEKVYKIQENVIESQKELNRFRFENLKVASTEQGTLVVVPQAQARNGMIQEIDLPKDYKFVTVLVRNKNPQSQVQFDLGFGHKAGFLKNSLTVYQNEEMRVGRRVLTDNDWHVFQVDASHLTEKERKKIGSVLLTDLSGTIEVGGVFLSKNPEFNSEWLKAGIRADVVANISARKNISPEEAVVSVNPGLLRVFNELVQNNPEVMAAALKAQQAKDAARIPSYLKVWAEAYKDIIHAVPELKNPTSRASKPLTLEDGIQEGKEGVFILPAEKNHKEALRLIEESDLFPGEIDSGYVDFIAEHLENGNIVLRNADNHKIVVNMSAKDFLEGHKVLLAAVLRPQKAALRDIFNVPEFGIITGEVALRDPRIPGLLTDAKFEGLRSLMGSYISGYYDFNKERRQAFREGFSNRSLTEIFAGMNHVLPELAKRLDMKVEDFKLGQDAGQAGYVAYFNQLYLHDPKLFDEVLNGKDYLAMLRASFTIDTDTYRAKKSTKLRYEAANKVYQTTVIDKIDRMAISIAKARSLGAQLESVNRLIADLEKFEKSVAENAKNNSQTLIPVRDRISQARQQQAVLKLTMGENEDIVRQLMGVVGLEYNFGPEGLAGFNPNDLVKVLVAKGVDRSSALRILTNVEQAQATSYDIPTKVKVSTGLDAFLDFGRLLNDQKTGSIADLVFNIIGFETSIERFHFHKQKKAERESMALNLLSSIRNLDFQHAQILENITRLTQQIADEKNIITKQEKLLEVEAAFFAKENDYATASVMKFTDQRTMVEQHRLNLVQLKERYEAETIRLRQLQDVSDHSRQILSRADVSKLLSESGIDAAKFLKNEDWRILPVKQVDKTEDAALRPTLVINTMADAQSAADLVFAQLENRAKQGKLDYPAAEWLSGYINLGVRILSYGPGQNAIADNHWTALGSGPENSFNQLAGASAGARLVLVDWTTHSRAMQRELAGEGSKALFEAAKQAWMRKFVIVQHNLSEAKISLNIAREHVKTTESKLEKLKAKVTQPNNKTAKGEVQLNIQREVTAAESELEEVLQTLHGTQRRYEEVFTNAKGDLGLSADVKIVFGDFDAANMEEQVPELMPYYGTLAQDNETLTEAGQKKLEALGQKVEAAIKHVRENKKMPAETRDAVVTLLTFARQDIQQLLTGDIPAHDRSAKLTALIWLILDADRFTASPEGFNQLEDFLAIRKVIVDISGLGGHLLGVSHLDHAWKDLALRWSLLYKNFNLAAFVGVSADLSRGWSLGVTPEWNPATFLVRRFILEPVGSAAKQNAGFIGAGVDSALGFVSQVLGGDTRRLTAQRANLVLESAKDVALYENIRNKDETQVDYLYHLYSVYDALEQAYASRLGQVAENRDALAWSDSLYRLLGNPVFKESQDLDRIQYIEPLHIAQSFKERIIDDLLDKGYTVSQAATHAQKTGALAGKIPSYQELLSKAGGNIDVVITDLERMKARKNIHVLSSHITDRLPDAVQGTGPVASYVISRASGDLGKVMDQINLTWRVDVSIPEFLGLAEKIRKLKEKSADASHAFALKKAEKSLIRAFVIYVAEQDHMKEVERVQTVAQKFQNEVVARMEVPIATQAELDSSRRAIQDARSQVENARNRFHLALQTLNETANVREDLNIDIEAIKTGLETRLNNSEQLASAIQAALLASKDTTRTNWSAEVERLSALIALEKANVQSLLWQQARFFVDASHTLGMDGLSVRIGGKLYILGSGQLARMAIADKEVQIAELLKLQARLGRQFDLRTQARKLEYASSMAELTRARVEMLVSNLENLVSTRRFQDAIGAGDLEKYLLRIREAERDLKDAKIILYEAELLIEKELGDVGIKIETQTVPQQSAAVKIPVATAPEAKPDYRVQEISFDQFISAAKLEYPEMRPFAHQLLELSRGAGKEDMALISPVELDRAEIYLANVLGIYGRKHGLGGTDWIDLTIRNWQAAQANGMVSKGVLVGILNNNEILGNAWAGMEVSVINHVNDQTRLEFEKIGVNLKMIDFFTRFSLIVMRGDENPQYKTVFGKDASRSDIENYWQKMMLSLPQVKKAADVFYGREQSLNSTDDFGVLLAWVVYLDQKNLPITPETMGSMDTQSPQIDGDAAGVPHSRRVMAKARELSIDSIIAQIEFFKMGPDQFHKGRTTARKALSIAMYGNPDAVFDDQDFYLDDVSGVSAWVEDLFRRRGIGQDINEEDILARAYEVHQLKKSVQSIFGEVPAAEMEARLLKFDIEPMKKRLEELEALLPGAQGDTLAKYSVEHQALKQKLENLIKLKVERTKQLQKSLPLGMAIAMSRRVDGFQYNNGVDLGMYQAKPREQRVSNSEKLMQLTKNLIPTIEKYRGSINVWSSNGKAKGYVEGIAEDILSDYETWSSLFNTDGTVVNGRESRVDAFFEGVLPKLRDHAQIDDLAKMILQMVPELAYGTEYVDFRDALAFGLAKHQLANPRLSFDDLIRILNAEIAILKDTQLVARIKFEATREVRLVTGNPQHEISFTRQYDMGVFMGLVLASAQEKEGSAKFLDSHSKVMDFIEQGGPRLARLLTVVNDVHKIQAGETTLVLSPQNFMKERRSRGEIVGRIYNLVIADDIDAELSVMERAAELYKDEQLRKWAEEMARERNNNKEGGQQIFKPLSPTDPKNFAEMEALVRELLLKNRTNATPEDLNVLRNRMRDAQQILDILGQESAAGIPEAHAGFIIGESGWGNAKALSEKFDRGEKMNHVEMDLVLAYRAWLALDRAERMRIYKTRLQKVIDFRDGTNFPDPALHQKLIANGAKIFKLMHPDAPFNVDAPTGEAMGFMMSEVERLEKEELSWEGLSNQYERLIALASNDAFNKYLIELGVISPEVKNIGTAISGFAKLANNQANASNVRQENAQKMYALMGRLFTSANLLRDQTKITEEYTTKIKLLETLRSNFVKSKGSAGISSLMQELKKIYSGISIQTEPGNSQTVNIWEIARQSYKLPYTALYRDKLKDLNPAQRQEAEKSIYDNIEGAFALAFLEGEIDSLVRLTEAMHQMPFYPVKDGAPNDLAYVAQFYKIRTIFNGYPVADENRGPSLENQAAANRERLFKSYRNAFNGTADPELGKAAQIAAQKDFVAGTASAMVNEFFSSRFEKGSKGLTVEKITSFAERTVQAWKFYHQYWEPRGIPINAAQMRNVVRNTDLSSQDLEDYFLVGATFEALARGDIDQIPNTPNDKHKNIRSKLAARTLEAARDSQRHGFSRKLSYDEIADYLTKYFTFPWKKVFGDERPLNNVAQALVFADSIDQTKVHLHVAATAQEIADQKANGDESMWWNNLPSGEQERWLLLISQSWALPLDHSNNARINIRTSAERLLTRAAMNDYAAYLQKQYQDLRTLVLEDGLTYDKKMSQDPDDFYRYMVLRLTSRPVVRPLERTDEMLEFEKGNKNGIGGIKSFIKHFLKVNKVLGNIRPDLMQQLESTSDIEVVNAVLNDAQTIAYENFVKANQPVDLNKILETLFLIRKEGEVAKLQEFLNGMLSLTGSLNEAEWYVSDTERKMPAADFVRGLLQDGASVKADNPAIQKMIVALQRDDLTRTQVKRAVVEWLAIKKLGLELKYPPSDEQILRFIENSRSIPLVGARVLAFKPPVLWNVAQSKFHEVTTVNQQTEVANQNRNYLETEHILKKNPFLKDRAITQTSKEFEVPKADILKIQKTKSYMLKMIFGFVALVFLVYTWITLRGVTDQKAALSSAVTRTGTLPASAVERQQNQGTTNRWLGPTGKLAKNLGVRAIWMMMFQFSFVYLFSLMNYSVIDLSNSSGAWNVVDVFGLSVPLNYMLSWILGAWAGAKIFKKVLPMGTTDEAQRATEHPEVGRQFTLIAKDASGKFARFRRDAETGKLFKALVDEDQLDISDGEISALGLWGNNPEEEVHESPNDLYELFVRDDAGNLVSLRTQAGRNIQRIPAGGKTVIQYFDFNNPIGQGGTLFTAEKDAKKEEKRKATLAAFRRLMEENKSLDFIKRELKLTDKDIKGLFLIENILDAAVNGLDPSGRVIVNLTTEKDHALINQAAVSPQSDAAEQLAVAHEVFKYMRRQVAIIGNSRFGNEGQDNVFAGLGNASNDELLRVGNRMIYWSPLAADHLEKKMGDINSGVDFLMGQNSAPLSTQLKAIPMMRWSGRYTDAWGIFLSFTAGVALAATAIAILAPVGLALGVMAAITAIVFFVGLFIGRHLMQFARPANLKPPLESQTYFHQDYMDHLNDIDSIYGANINGLFRNRIQDLDPAGKPRVEADGSPAWRVNDEGASNIHFMDNKNRFESIYGYPHIRSLINSLRKSVAIMMNSTNGAGVIVPETMVVTNRNKRTKFTMLNDFMSILGNFFATSLQAYYAGNLSGKGLVNLPTYYGYGDGRNMLPSKQMASKFVGLIVLTAAFISLVFIVGTASTSFLILLLFLAAGVGSLYLKLSFKNFKGSELEREAAFGQVLSKLLSHDFFEGAKLGAKYNTAPAITEPSTDSYYSMYQRSMIRWHQGDLWRMLAAIFAPNIPMHARLMWTIALLGYYNPFIFAFWLIKRAVLDPVLSGIANGFTLSAGGTSLIFGQRITEFLTIPALIPSWAVGAALGIFFTLLILGLMRRPASQWTDADRRLYQHTNSTVRLLVPFVTAAILAATAFIPVMAGFQALFLSFAAVIVLAKVTAMLLEKLKLSGHLNGITFLTGLITSAGLGALLFSLLSATGYIALALTMPWVIWVIVWLGIVVFPILFGSVEGYLYAKWVAFKDTTIRGLADLDKHPNSMFANSIKVLIVGTQNFSQKWHLSGSAIIFQGLAWISLIAAIGFVVLAAFPATGILVAIAAKLVFLNPITYGLAGKLAVWIGASIVGKALLWAVLSTAALRSAWKFFRIVTVTVQEGQLPWGTFTNVSGAMPILQAYIFDLRYITLVTLGVVFGAAFFHSIVFAMIFALPFLFSAAFTVQMTWFGQFTLPPDYPSLEGGPHFKMRLPIATAVKMKQVILEIGRPAKKSELTDAERAANSKIYFVGKIPFNLTSDINSNYLNSPDFPILENNPDKFTWTSFIHTYKVLAKLVWAMTLVWGRDLIFGVKDFVLSFLSGVRFLGKMIFGSNRIVTLFEAYQKMSDFDSRFQVRTSNALHLGFYLGIPLMLIGIVVLAAVGGITAVPFAILIPPAIAFLLALPSLLMNFLPYNLHAGIKTYFGQEAKKIGEVLGTSSWLFRKFHQLHKNASSSNRTWERRDAHGEILRDGDKPKVFKAGDSDLAAMLKNSPITHLEENMTVTRFFKFNLHDQKVYAVLHAGVTDKLDLRKSADFLKNLAYLLGSGNSRITAELESGQETVQIDFDMFTYVLTKIDETHYSVEIKTPKVDWTSAENQIAESLKLENRSVFAVGELEIFNLLKLNSVVLRPKNNPEQTVKFEAAQSTHFKLDEASLQNAVREAVQAVSRLESLDEISLPADSSLRFQAEVVSEYHIDGVNILPGDKVDFSLAHVTTANGHALALNLVQHETLIPIGLFVLPAAAPVPFNRSEMRDEPFIEKTVAMDAAMRESLGEALKYSSQMRLQALLAENISTAVEGEMASRPGAQTEQVLTNHNVYYELLLNEALPEQIQFLSDLVKEGRKVKVTAEAGQMAQVKATLRSFSGLAGLKVIDIAVVRASMAEAGMTDVSRQVMAFVGHDALMRQGSGFLIVLRSEIRTPFTVISRKSVVPGAMNIDLEQQLEISMRSEQRIKQSA